MKLGVLIGQRDVVLGVEIVEAVCLTFPGMDFRAVTKLVIEAMKSGDKSWSTDVVAGLYGEAAPGAVRALDDLEVELS